MDPETGASSQRRSWSRVPLRAKVRMEFADQRYFLSEWAVNLSPGGMFVRSESPMAAGQRFTFEAALTPKGPRFSGLAEVLWVRREWDRAARPPGFAVHFLELEDSGRQAIARLAEVFLESGVAAMQEELQRQAAAWQSRRMEDDSTDELPPADPPLPDTEAAVPGGLPVVADDADTAELPPPDATGLIALVPAPRAAGDLALAVPAAAGAAVAPPQRPQAAPLGVGSDTETPAQGLAPADLPGDDDPIEETKVLMDPTAPLTVPGRSAGRGPLIAALLALLVGAGAWVGWRYSQRPPAAEVTASARIGGDAATAPAGGAMPAAARAAAPAAAGFQTLRDVSWASAPEGLWVTLATEGELPADSLRRHRLPPEGEEPAREVLQFFGAQRGFHLPALPVDHPLLSKIRFGYHALGTGNELRVVLVLPATDVQVSRVEQGPGAVRVLLVAGAGAADVASPGPAAAERAAGASTPQE